MTNFKKGVFWSLLLVGFGVQAAPEYPKPFEPTVIYKDTKLIEEHAKRAATTVAPVAKTAAQPAKAVESPAVAEPVRADAKGATGIQPEEYAVGAVVLGLVGFFLWSRKSTAPSAGQAPVVRTGQSAVEKYVSDIASGNERANGVTGVARYLNGLEVAARVTKPDTGVTKYLTSLQLSERLAAKQSSVASYLKNLG
jgi:hypothetical protein